jgi:hypothetical protein
MAKIWSQESWTGGQSTGSRIGYKNSFDDGIGIDFRTDPDKLSILRKLTKDSGTVVTDLVKWMVEYNGNIYMYGASGGLYKKSTSNVYSLLSTIPNSTGQGLQIFNTLNTDLGWYAQNAQLGRIAGVGGIEGLDNNYLYTMSYNRFLSNSFGVASGYTPPTSISETSTNKFSFVATKMSMFGFNIYFGGKGTGTVTVTLHDANDSSVATASLTAGARTDNADNLFEFSNKAFFLNVGATYHIHVTSTVSDGGIGTGTANDLSKAQIKGYTRPLETDGLFHPMEVFQNLLCIGNGRFLATMDDSEVWDNERLIFPRGESVRCLETIGSYIAIGTNRGTSIEQYGSSRVYFWDGVSPTYNDFIDIDGQINAMANTGNNKLIIMHGTEGNITIYNGGITYKRKLKNLGDNLTVEIYPGALAVWEKIVYFGMTGGTSQMDRVIYAYGTKDNDYPTALSKDYVISTGNYAWNNVTNRGVQIGCILGISSSKFYVSWSDNTTGVAIQGIDMIDTSSDQATAFVDSLRIDGGDIDREKKSTSINVVCEPLTAGQKIEVYTKLDQAAAGYTLLGDLSYTSDTSAIYKSFPISPKWLEMQIRLKLYSSSGVSPTVLSVSVDMQMSSQQQGGKRLAGNL